MYTYEQIIRTHYFRRPKNIQDGEKQVRRWGSTSWIKLTEQVQLYTYALYWETQRDDEASFPCGPKIMCINQGLVQDKSRNICMYDIRRPSEMVCLRMKRLYVRTILQDPCKLKMGKSNFVAEDQHVDQTNRASPTIYIHTILETRQLKMGKISKTMGQVLRVDQK